MFENINKVVSYYNMKSSDFDGRYEFNKHKDEIIYDNSTHIYHSSGLCRIVYADKKENYVLKIPLDVGEWDENWLKDEKMKRFIPIAIKHNLYEGLAYENAPQKYRKYLAKTELLDNGWLKQEYCDVYRNCISHDFREFGITKDLRVVMFDYDKLIFDNRHDVYDTPDYDCLKPLIENCEQYIIDNNKGGERYRNKRIDLIL